MKKICFSTTTHKIVIISVHNEKGSQEKAYTVGSPRDCTNEALAAVFFWFMEKLKEQPQKNSFEMRYDELPFVLKMERE